MCHARKTIQNGVFTLMYREVDRQEFIADYCERSGVTWEWLSQYKKAIPCDCGDEACIGWAMVNKDEIVNKNGELK